MPTVAEHVESLSCDLKRLQLALSVLKQNASNEDDFLIASLESKIISKTRIIESGMRFIDMMSDDRTSGFTLLEREWSHVDRGFLPGIREKHYRKLCDRRLSESDYWMLVFRGILIDDFKIPTFTCSRCAGIIDIANANDIPWIMRDYMPECICDTSHHNTGWKTQKTRLLDDRSFSGFSQQMLTKSDNDCGD
jgi:hypothetical protein